MELTELVALLGEGPRFVLMHNIVPLLYNGLFLRWDLFNES